MTFPLLVVIVATVLALASFASGLGTACSVPLGAGTAAPGDPYWMQSVKHQGISAYNSNPVGYQVFRNVKDFGAKGDGVTDDTAAINAAIEAGGRCGRGCDSSTLTPGIIFFPTGNYLVSRPIIALYYSQLIGDPKNPPTLLAASNFNGVAVIDADPYIPGGGGAQYYTNQNNFFRSVRNFIIDVRRVPANKLDGTGIHWQVSQATSLFNVVFYMSTATDTVHRGVWMENGSGGFMSDLIFNGGKYAMWVGNQQFTVRNITINDAQTGVYTQWNWGWTFQGVNINNCQIGFDLSTEVAAEAIIDAVVTNTPIFIRSVKPSNGTLGVSLVLNNVKLANVPTAVTIVDGPTILAGGTKTIASWGKGNVFKGSNSATTPTQGNIHNARKPSVLLDGSGKIFGKPHPQYEAYALDQIVSVRDNGAKGDGRTDDTAALQAIFTKYSGCKIIFFDAGTYIVTSTLTIPAGTQMIGEAWSVISGSGSAFQDINKPQAVIRVGDLGSQGILEISDIIFSTVGSTPGAIVVEWNIKQPRGQQGGAGMWDSHIRLGGVAGTNLGVEKCPSTGSGGYPECFAAFLGLHLQPMSTAYLEGTWVWLADHDFDALGTVSVYSGRGILSESTGPVWMIGTAEHHVLYQYSLVNARDHYMGLIQTESPYYQPSPVPPLPFTVNPAYKDPGFPAGLESSWGLTVKNSNEIIVFGAGLYSFFSNYTTECVATHNCQSQVLNIDSASSVAVYSLSTVAAIYQLSMDGRGIVDQSLNRNGFASTVTAWSKS